MTRDSRIGHLCGTLLLCGIGSLGLADEPSNGIDSPSQYETGRAVFDQWCWECHGKDNPHGSGTWSMRKRDGNARSPYLEDRSDLNYEYVAFVVRNGQLFMPSFRYTEISDEELVALSAYLDKGKPKE